jgi:hypothetical protein
MKKNTIIARVELLASGHAQIATISVITEGGKEIARSKPHRFVMCPGDDLLDLPDDTRAVIEAHWTPDRVSAFEASRQKAEEAAV